MQADLIAKLPQKQAIKTYRPANVQSEADAKKEEAKNEEAAGQRIQDP